MKILIACDMEGITGVTHWDQVNPSHPEYQRFRKLMTADVNAAIKGAFESGALEIVVTDGHWNGNNILVEELDPRVRLNSGLSTSPYSMMQGIDNTFDAVIFIGYHARAGSQNAILDHTWSTKIANVWLNDTLVGEYGLSAAIAGYFGVPVVMISGDQTVCNQATELLGSLEIAVVKQATGRFSAECLCPSISQASIREAVRRALIRLKKSDTPLPYNVDVPITVTIEFTHSHMADYASQFPGVERDGLRVAVTAEDINEAFLAFRTAVDLAEK